MKEQINIELNELKATFLSDYVKGIPFVVPPHYFSSMEDEITSQLLPVANNFNTPKEYFSELENSILTQSSVPTKSAISVPDNYFEGLESRILEQIDEEDKTPVRSINMKKSLQLWGSVAAAFVIGFFFFNTTKTEECITFACLLEQTTFTEDELLHVYDEEIANEMIDDVDFLDNISLEDEEILDYLIDEDFDLEALDNMYEL